MTTLNSQDLNTVIRYSNTLSIMSLKDIKAQLLGWFNVSNIAELRKACPRAAKLDFRYKANWTLLLAREKFLPMYAEYN